MVSSGQWSKSYKRCAQTPYFLDFLFFPAFPFSGFYRFSRFSVFSAFSIFSRFFFISGFPAFSIFWVSEFLDVSIFRIFGFPDFSIFWNFQTFCFPDMTDSFPVFTMGWYLDNVIQSVSESDFLVNTPQLKLL